MGNQNLIITEDLKNYMSAKHDSYFTHQTKKEHWLLFLFSIISKLEVDAKDDGLKVKFLLTAHKRGLDAWDDEAGALCREK